MGTLQSLQEQQNGAIEKKKMSDRKKKHRTNSEFESRPKRLKDPNRWKFDPKRYVKDEDCEYYDDEIETEEDPQQR